MKVKKIFVLSVLMVMMIMFFTGCSYNITNEFKESQIIAEEFLATKGYEVPKGYEVRYVNESEKQLYVEKTGVTKILFNILEDKPKIVSINVSGFLVNDIISWIHINQIEQVANDFLNTAGYNIPQECSIKYLGKDKKQLEVTLKIDKDSNQLKIIITFDITEDGLEIIDIQWYKNERGFFIGFFVVLFFWWIIILGLINR